MIDAFIKSRKDKKRRSATINVLEYVLRTAEGIIGKPLDDITYDDLNLYTSNIRVERNLANGTVELMQRKFIQYYLWMFNQTDDPRYHKIVRMLKNDKMDKQKTHVQAGDILTVEEAKKLINVATLERDRCLIATMFESGMRAGELLSLTTKDLIINDADHTVTFNIGIGEGLKSDMPRSVLCLEVHGYVTDWLKCNPSNKFMSLSTPGIAVVLKRLYKKAGIDKPCNPHMLRHSAITHAASLKMTETEMSYRFWGIPHSSMVSVYIHLNEQMQAQGYRNAKGMGDNSKIINPLAFKCVECGRLIQSGNICKQCSEIKELKEEISLYRNTIGDVRVIKKDMEDVKNLMKTSGFNKVTGYQMEVDVYEFDKDKTPDKKKKDL